MGRNIDRDVVGSGPSSARSFSILVVGVVIVVLVCRRRTSVGGWDGATVGRAVVVVGVALSGA